MSVGTYSNEIWRIGVEATRGHDERLAFNIGDILVPDDGSASVVKARRTERKKIDYLKGQTVQLESGLVLGVAEIIEGLKLIRGLDEVIPEDDV